MRRILGMGLKGMGLLLGLILLLDSLIVVAKHPGVGGMLLLGALGTLGMGACSLVCGALFGADVSRLRVFMTGHARAGLAGQPAVAAAVAGGGRLPAPLERRVKAREIAYLGAAPRRAAQSEPSPRL